MLMCVFEGLLAGCCDRIVEQSASSGKPRRQTGSVKDAAQPSYEPWSTALIRCAYIHVCRYIYLLMEIEI